jgi:primosomal protein N' (replication factor Y)
MCHCCGRVFHFDHTCPKCHSHSFYRLGMGTEKLEENLQLMFPNAYIVRMDADSTRKKNAHAKLLKEFEEKGDILVGTQMIVKGHDFPKVTLVGALAADMSLYTDDYRSGERTFQLLTQAAGRAGRGDRPGEVVIQTYDPEHYAIEASAAQDYEAFYEKEIRYRSLMGYPPVENLMAVLAACEDEVLLEKACKYLKEYILRIKGQAQLDVIGPASPGVDKIKDIYRRVIYVKAPEYRTLVVLKDRMEQYIEINSGFQKMRIQFDFNPMNL